MTQNDPSHVSVVIPTFNEAAAIAGVIGEIPRDIASEIIVADGGSTDGTRDIARAAGALVLDAGRGYGRACQMGAEAACNSVIVFLDGDGADRGDLLGLIAGPVLAGTQDLVLASRTRGQRDPGAMLWHQVLAGRIAGWGIGALYGIRYSDMCAFRAISRDVAAPSEYAGDNLRLEYRDADEGCPGWFAYPGGTGTVSMQGRWLLESRWIGARHAACRRQDRVYLRPDCRPSR